MDGRTNNGSRTGSTPARELKAADFETIFNLSSDLICTAAPSGEFLRVSPSCERILGYTPEEMIGLGWARLVHPDDLEPTQLEVAEQMKGSDTVNFVNRYRCKDGSYKTLEWQGTFAENGVLYGAGRDITDRRRAERKLAEAAVCLDTMGEALLVLDLNKVVVRTNRAAVTLWGYDKKEELVGLGMSDLFPERTISRHQAEMTAVAEADAPTSFESVALTKKGDEIPIMLTGTAMKDANGELAGFVGVFRDITQRKRLEASLTEVRDEERDRLRRDLHDSIGQQLTGLRFLVASLRQAVPESCLKALNLAMKIDQVASDALGASRQIAQALEPLSGEPDALVTALQDLAASVDNRYGIQCRLTLPKPMLVEDYDTSNQLFLITQEAVMNSVKHAQAGRIDISVSLQDHDARLVVEDDGVGVSRNTKREGMGLRIMQSRAKLINASLDIQAGNAGGTTVICSWKTQSTC